jgi:putative flavoprotein involved in K+ transport
MLHTVIIGAGQAGLSTGYFLKQLGVPFEIWDAEARLGENWRSRWDSLSLFSPAKYSSLPGFPFPKPPLSLPSKDETADYIAEYARKFDLPVKLGMKVDALTYEEGIFHLSIGAQQIQAKQVVIATGTFHTPYIPKFPHSPAADILQIHVNAYKNVLQLQEGPTLVVGTGASGTQIAAEIAQTRKVYLSGPPTGNMPRSRLGKDIYWWLYTTGMMHIRKESWLGRRLLRNTGGADALIGKSLDEIVKENALLRRGVLVDFQNGLPEFIGGESAPDIRNIVWATGYRNDYSWIHLPIFDENGQPTHRRGAAVGCPNLYFVGLKFQYRADSSNMGGVGRDAKWVAEQIAAANRKP